MKRILLLFLFIGIALSGLLVGTGSAQDMGEPTGIPRGSFVERQLAGPVVEAGAQAATLPPQTIQTALLKGGTALVFGCYNSDSPNIAEWNSQLPAIAATGMGHVRLTCSMDVLEQGTTGQVNPTRYAQVLQFVNLAWQNGLVTTVDVHNTGMRECAGCDWTSNYMFGITIPAVAARHTALTTNLLQLLARDVPHDRFVFQGANEPIDQANWYTYQRSLFTSLRSVCADCTIEIMARDWQGLEETVYSLDTSFATGPVVVDVHFYEPIDLTHCSYPGTANNCPGMAYPGYHDTWRGHIYYDMAWMRTHFTLLRNWRDQRGVFVTIGEFGTTADLADDVQTRYFADLVSLFHEFGFGYTVYEFDKNFGVKQNPSAMAVLFSGQAVPTPIPTVIVPTTVPTIAPTGQPTLVPTAMPTVTGDIDLNELVRLAQEVGARRADVQTAQTAVNAAQVTYQAALAQVTTAEQALRTFILSWIGQ